MSYPHRSDRDRNLTHTGDPQPLHPDEYGLARVLTMPRDEFWDHLAPLTDAEMEAMWADEAVWRDLQAHSHRHGGCQHVCESGACVAMAGLKDPLCFACQVTEVSDAERHRASRRAREKSA